MICAVGLKPSLFTATGVVENSHEKETTSGLSFTVESSLLEGFATASYTICILYPCFVPSTSLPIRVLHEKPKCCLSCCVATIPGARSAEPSQAMNSSG